jgi:hypothetical protein
MEDETIFVPEVVQPPKGFFCQSFVWCGGKLVPDGVLTKLPSSVSEALDMIGGERCKPMNPPNFECSLV